MFYVNSKSGNKYGVVDTKDRIEEFYTEKQLRSFKVPILGVYESDILVVAPPDVIRSYISNKLVKDLVERIPLWYTFDLVFRSKPNGLNIVTNYGISIRRSSKDTYTLFDENRNYRTFNSNDMISHLEWYIKFHQLTHFSYKE